MSLLIAQTAMTELRNEAFSLSLDWVRQSVVALPAHARCLYLEYTECRCVSETQDISVATEKLL